MCVFVLRSVQYILSGTGTVLVTICYLVGVDILRHMAKVLVLANNNTQPCWHQYHHLKMISILCHTKINKITSCIEKILRSWYACIHLMMKIKPFEACVLINRYGLGVWLIALSEKNNQVGVVDDTVHSYYIQPLSNNSPDMKTPQSQQFPSNHLCI